jgi:1-acyl-sn-glycerol-3-phosphate acyltransferase
VLAGDDKGGYGHQMRKFAFAVAYWGLSVTYGLMAALSALLPGRGATAWWIRRYVRRMVQAMGAFAGIRIAVEGKENLLQGAFIVASKHQSWGDGFATYNQFDDLAFVTGDHLEKLPLLGPILKKLGAIVVDSCGGSEARAALKARAADAHREGRKILIFPEGALAPVGSKYRYRSGVWHMARDFGLPVVPLATNLGLYWPPEGIARAGTATLAFLPPIVAGEDKDAFLSQLESVIEEKTATLVARANGGAVVPARLVPRPDETEHAPAAAAP